MNPKNIYKNKIDNHKKKKEKENESKEEYEYEKLNDIVIKNNPPDLFPNDFCLENDLIEQNREIVNIDISKNQKENYQKVKQEIKKEIKLNQKENINSESVFNNSINFSIKLENKIQDLDVENNSINNTNKISFIKINPKLPIVIVYHIGNEYLVPMYLIEEKSYLIKLKYLDSETEIIKKKEDLSYSSIDTLIPFGNLVDLKNESKLSILKNLQFRINSNQPYIFISKMLMLLNYKYNKNNNKERDFFFREFIFSEENKFNLFLSNGNSPELILKKFIEYNNYHTYSRELFLIESTIKFIEIVKTKILFIYKSSLGFEIIPLLSMNKKKNILYSKNFILSEMNSNNNNLEKEVKLNVPEKIISKIFSNNSVKEIFKIFCFNDSNNIIIINKIYNILLGNKEEFKNSLNLFILAYIICNYKEIGKEYLLNSKYHENKIMMKAKVFMNILKEDNMVFFSNIILLILIKYITLIINVKLKRYKTSNKNSLFIFFNEFQKKENEKILNALIMKRINLSYKIGEDFKEDDFIGNYLYKYYNENINQFIESLTDNEKTFVNIIQDNFDLDFLNQNKLNNKEKENLIDIFQVFFDDSINSIKKIEMKNLNNIKQIVNYDFPNENYNEFLSNKESIFHFFKTTNIIDFIQLYKKQKNYFREYSIKNFFHYFLPILSDIDKSFHQNKIDEYLKKINNYLKELQSYQKINEKFSIKNEYIYLNFKIFEILMILLFNVYEEKAKIIQKCFLRKYLKNGIFNNIKLKIIKIQRAFKLFIINKYKKKPNSETIEFLLKKYKGNDPMLILFFINSKKAIKNLSEENLKLKEKLKSSSFNKKKVQEKNPFNLNKRNSNSNRHNNSSNKEEIQNLKLQLNETKTKYKEQVGIIMEYERRMKNFIQSVNSNQQVKDIFIKNGIQIN